MTSNFAEPQLLTDEIILASASPRRYELLSSIGLRVRVAPSSYAEPDMPELSPAALSLHHAIAKARDVAPRFATQLVIAADTVVDVDGKAFGKPLDEHTAIAMLTRLSGRSHFVHTSIALAYREGFITHTESTEVQFYTLDASSISAYVFTGEPFDKAGGYGIQGRGALLVARTTGDFYTVMGFPLARFAQLLPQIGLRL